MQFKIIFVLECTINYICNNYYCIQFDLHTAPCVVLRDFHIRYNSHIWPVLNTLSISHSLLLPAFNSSPIFFLPSIGPPMEALQSESGGVWLLRVVVRTVREAVTSPARSSHTLPPAGDACDVWTDSSQSGCNNNSIELQS